MILPSDGIFGQLKKSFSSPLITLPHVSMDHVIRTAFHLCCAAGTRRSACGFFIEIKISTDSKIPDYFFLVRADTPRVGKLGELHLPNLKIAP